MGDRGHNRHGPKRGGCRTPFEESSDPVKYNVDWDEVYFRTKWRLHPSSRLATIDTNRKLGAVPPYRGSCDPSYTTSPEPTFTSVPSGIFIHPALWKFGHNRHGPKIGWGGCALFTGVSWVPIEHEVAWAEAYLHTKWHLSPSSPLATI